ncbi:MAG: FAD-dependent oxidoreductase [Thermoproteota archaeon]|nr:FAD-dependent oxidoreductase [Thermoproteota archaeon]
MYVTIINNVSESDNPSMKKKVLILGAGYGGVFAAAYLCKEKEYYYDITLIDQNSHLELIQQISYIILGSKDAGDVTVRIDNLFRNEIGKGQIEFVEALVESIDLNNKTVKVLKNGNTSQDHKYDYLVIALGSETGYFDIPGAKENTLSFRSVQDALKIRKSISNLDDNSTIIIGGGGPTGVSLAAALAESDALHDKNVEIKIMDASGTLLPEWDPRLIKTSEKVLTSKGIEILTRKKIQEITPKSVITESGDQIRSDCTIWTAGVKGRSIKIAPELEKTRSDTIPVDKYFKLPGFDNAFAIGDICEFRPGSNQDQDSMKAPPPKLAQLAVRQGRFVAENIIKKEKGENLNDEFRFFQRGHTISLGHKSIAILNGLLVTGNMCNYTEDTIVDNFITEIKNRERGISVKARAAAKDVAAAEETDYPAAFDFVTYATSRAYMELVK